MGIPVKLESGRWIKERKLQRGKFFSDTESRQSYSCGIGGQTFIRKKNSVEALKNL